MRSQNICPEKTNCVFFQNVQKTQKNSKKLKFYMAKYPISFLSKIPENTFSEDFRLRAPLDSPIYRSHRFKK